MNAVLDKEQMKALVKEAMRELLAEARYDFPEQAQVMKQVPSWTNATRPRDTRALMDRADIFRMLD